MTFYSVPLPGAPTDSQGFYILFILRAVSSSHQTDRRPASNRPRANASVLSVNDCRSSSRSSTSCRPPRRAVAGRQQSTDRRLVLLQEVSLFLGGLGFFRHVLCRTHRVLYVPSRLRDRTYLVMIFPHPHVPFPTHILPRWSPVAGSTIVPLSVTMSSPGQAEAKFPR
jgi:hypothetical protein